MPAVLPTPRKVFDVVGEAQVNSDGLNRQEELLRCVPGEAVALRREPQCGKASPAITILSARGVPIGRLTSQYATLLAPLLDDNRPYRARIQCLRGGVPHYPRYGARISIAWDGRREPPHRPLDKHQLRYRRRKLAAVLRRRRPFGSPAAGVAAIAMA